MNTDPRVHQPSDAYDMGDEARLLFFESPPLPTWSTARISNECPAVTKTIVKTLLYQMHVLCQ